MKKGASGGHELVPIDHGYVLPDSFQDISFEWLYWPQARAPLGECLRSGMAEKGMHALQSFELPCLIQACASKAPCACLASDRAYASDMPLACCGRPSMRRMLTLLECLQMRARGRI